MANLLKMKEYITTMLNQSGAKALNEHVAEFSMGALSESVDRVDEGRKDYTAGAVDHWMKRKEKGYQKRKNAQKDKSRTDESSFMNPLLEEFEGHVHALNKFLDMTSSNNTLDKVNRFTHSMARHHARSALQSFKNAQNTPDEYRHRYLKDAHKHLGKVEYHINRANETETA